MKFVQVIPDFQLGGIQKAGCVLATGLAEKGHMALVVGRDGGDRFLETLPTGVTHEIVGDLSPTDYAQRILAFDPDVIHIHDAAYDEPLVEALSAAGARIDGKPLLISTPVFGRPPKSRSILRKTRTAVVGTYIHHRLRHWLGMSVERAYQSGVAYTPVVSFQTTDPPCSTLDSPEVLAARRAEFGIPADALVVGRIGRDAPEKWGTAHHELIDRFLSKHPHGVWLSVGYPAERDPDTLRERWGERFISLPQSSDYTLLTRAFASMDLQVFISCAGECFAATICEPAGVGLPTIAAANPLRDNGQSEQVVDGQNGYLVMTMDQALERIDHLLTRPEELKQLKRDTQAYAEARWTPSQITDELIAFSEAWMQDNPTATPHLRRTAAEAKTFSAGYKDRIVALEPGGPMAKLWLRFKLAAVSNWNAFQLGSKLKRFIR